MRQKHTRMPFFTHVSYDYHRVHIYTTRNLGYRLVQFHALYTMGRRSFFAKAQQQQTREDSLRPNIAASAGRARSRAAALYTPHYLILAQHRRTSTFESLDAAACVYRRRSDFGRRTHRTNGLCVRALCKDLWLFILMGSSSLSFNGRLHEY